MAAADITIICCFARSTDRSECRFTYLTKHDTMAVDLTLMLMAATGTFKQESPQFLTQDDDGISKVALCPLRVRDVIHLT
jgi:hypothetical protein